jgi:hypothetical protein
MQTSAHDVTQGNSARASVAGALPGTHPELSHTHITTIMKGTTFLATAIAAGTASAGVHKMPLKKVPLSKQLVSSTA